MIDLSYPAIAADVEYDSGILGCSFANSKESIYVTDKNQILDIFNKLSENNTEVVFHWGFFDIQTFYKFDWDIPELNIKDTSFIYPESLKVLAAKLLTRNRMSFLEAKSYGYSSEIFFQYAAGDAADTISIYEMDIPEGYEKSPDYDLKCSAVQKFAKISLTGIPTNLDNAYEQLYNTEGIIQELKEWVKYELGSTSDQKISKFLEDYYHKDLEYTDKRRVAANIYNCKLLKDQHELIEFIYVWKLLRSFKTKYIKPFIIAAEDTGKYYPKFTQVRRDAVEKIPFNIGDFYEIKNHDVRLGLNMLDYDSMFEVKTQRLSGLEEFIKLKDHSNICNYVNGRIWTVK